MTDRPLVVLSCGEASGDLYASRVAQALHERRPELRIAGIAGPHSRASGVEPWFESEDLAVMGFVEILRHLPRLRRIGLKLVDRAEQEGAALFLPVDYPGFHLRVAERMHARGIPTLDFIPPKTWSWGKGRQKKLRRNVERCAVIFPFEEKHYGDAGIDARFVGHPLVDLHSAKLQVDRPQGEGLLLAPGSRRQELARIVPILAEALILLRKSGFAEPIRVSLAPGADASALQPLVDAGATLTDEALVDALLRHRVAVVCSGTATMEAALTGTPHVIVYRTGFWTYQIARRVAAVEHIGMANIVLGRRAFPELLQGDLGAQAVATKVQELFLEPSAARAAQLVASEELATMLGQPGCFSRVADLALEFLDGR